MIKNSFLNLLGLAVPIVAALICIPPTFSALGSSDAGVLLLIWGLINSSALLDFGLGRALTYSLANTGKTNSSSIIAFAFWISLLLGIAFGALLFIGSGSLAEHLGDPSSEAVFTALAWSIPFIINTSILRGVLEAERKFALVNAIRIPTGALNFVAPLLVVWVIAPDIVLVAWSLTAGRVLTFLLFLSATLPRASSSLWRVNNLDGSRALMIAGGWMTVSNMAGPVMNLVERMVIGGQLSLSSVTTYATPQEFVARLAIVPNAISVALFPEVSSKNIDRDRLGYVYKNCILTVLVLTAAPSVAVFLFAKDVLSIWIGVEFANLAEGALQVFSIGGLIGALAQIPFVVIQGRGGARFTGILHIVEVAVFCIALAVVIENWALTGVLALWLFRVVVDAAVLFWRAQRYVSFPSATGSGSGLTLFLCTLACLPLAGVESLATRAAAVCVVVVLTIICMVSLLSLRNGTKND
ncbi:MAG: oligosaccharide flippase family protein [Rhizobium rhizophilum]|uniref:oligosaccharide flippase family protein n=1 Tax=Rhizobium rhizophilum TaxID=1850373 RepID=UPI00391A0AF2